jgi:tRNA threonylcarbamoyladenosine biosynthesis protein TsaB
MKILSFESSAKAGSVALLEDGRLVGEYYQNCGQTHSRTLLKMAEDLLANCGVDRVDAVACAAGPGSFTGVRIGVAAAKGYAWGAELPCVGVSTIESMAQQGRSFDGLVCCVMDARRDQVYHGLFRCKDGILSRLVEDCAISIAELEAELLEKINELGIGPQGFGGKTTALCVNIEKCPTHIAGLPVAVNINCHVTRHKTEVL